MEEDKRERRVIVDLTTKNTFFISIIIQPLFSWMTDQIKALDAHKVDAHARQQTKEEMLKQVKESMIVLASPEAVL